MTQPPPKPANPWDADPEVDEAGRPWEADPLADEPAAAPAAPQTESGYTHPLARFGAGGLQAVKAAVNPMTYARALKEMAGLGLNIARAAGPGFVTPTPELVEAGQGLVSAPGAIVRRATESPEGFGEIATSAALSAVPAGGIAAGAARRLGMTPASRAYNVKRALRAPAGSVSARSIEAMAPEIDMPIVASPRKLAKAMTEAKGEAGAAVGAAEAALPATDISLSRAAGRIEPPPGQWVPDAQGVLEFVPDDPQAFSAYRASLRRLEAAGGPTGTVTTPDAIRLKRSAQEVADRGRAYTSERAGLQSRAAEARGSALREELEAIPGPESAEFTRANRRFQVAATAEEPIVAEAARLSDLPIASRGVEMLLGRAIPGSGFARQALGGLAGGQLLDSTLFHTVSAAVKRRVIDALQSGQPQLATDILFRASVADAQTRRAAAAALAAQGEGVIAP